VVRVAREAVPARHLAAAVGIDRPAEGHRAPVEAVQQVLGLELTIFDAAALVDRAPEPGRHPGRRDAGLYKALAPGGRHVLSIQSPRKPGDLVFDPRVVCSVCLAAPASAAARRAAGPCATVAPRAAADSAPLRLWARLVDHEIAIPEEPTVQHLDCL